MTDRVPLIMMLEGAGFRADGHTPARTPTDLLAQARCSGRVPLVTAVLGASAGHGALVAPMSDFTVMTEQASIFTAGPPVVFTSLGETITKEDLGGPAVAVASGLVHNAARDDARGARPGARLPPLLPVVGVVLPAGRRTATTSARVPCPRCSTSSLATVGGSTRCATSSTSSSTTSSLFEVQPEFGRSVVCMLARLGGHPVAVVANQPRVLAGSIDVDGADKAAHFITVADSFHLPLVFLADNPGVLPGSASERRGILRSGARMYAAQTLATTPKFEVTLRKAYGFGSMVMGMIPFDAQSAVFAFPGATMGAMGANALEPGERRRRGRGGPPPDRRARGVVPLGELTGVRRADRSPRDPQRAAPLARACAVPAPGAARSR